jgi:hypothetical protein
MSSSQEVKSCRIWGFHGDEYEDGCLQVKSCLSMMFFWVVTTCRLVGWYHRPENGDGMFLRNVGFYLLVHTASQPRRIWISWPPCKPQISQSLVYLFDLQCLESLKTLKIIFGRWEVTLRPSICRRKLIYSHPALGRLLSGIGIQLSDPACLYAS